MDTALLSILEREKEQLLVKLNLIERTIFAYRKGAMVFPEGKVVDIQELLDHNWLHEQSALQAKYVQYNINQPARNKVLMIINAEKRFLHVREIARIMQQLEEGTSISQLIKKISPALSSLKKIEGTFLISIEVGRSHFNTFWGCKDWLTENGEIKLPYMYNDLEVSRPAKLSLLSLK